MQQESGRFSQQAINRIAEIAIARQLKQDVEIRVDITATLKQLGKGQIDAITILIQGLILSGNLRTEDYQLDIGAVTVKPLSAVKGRIQLVHPSQGKLRIVIGEEDLTAALDRAMNQAVGDCAAANLRLEQRASVHCRIADNAIRLDSTCSTTPESIGLTPVLDAQGVRWQPSADGAISAELLTDLLTCLDRLLNLKDFEQKGLFLSVQEIQLTNGKLQLFADAQIQSFPPS